MQMQNKKLISLLEDLDPDKEISIFVKSIETGNQIAVTYDIGYDINEYDELVLRIQVECLNA